MGEGKLRSTNSLIGRFGLKFANKEKVGLFILQ